MHSTRNTLRVIALTTAAALAASFVGMARAQDVPATDVWFIQGAISVPGESAPRLTKFVVRPGEGNHPFVLVFDSKDECEATRHDDPEVAGPLALFTLSVTNRGATVEITCEKFVHPKVEPPGQPI